MAALWGTACNQILRALQLVLRTGRYPDISTFMNYKNKYWADSIEFSFRGKTMTLFRKRI